MMYHAETSNHRKYLSKNVHDLSMYDKQKEEIKSAQVWNKMG